MESRAFIKEAKALIEEIKMADIISVSPEEDHAKRQNIQKRINGLFQSLMNPTLPSAFKLRDAAQDYGYQVSPQVLRRLDSFETL